MAEEANSAGNAGNTAVSTSDTSTSTATTTAAPVTAATVNKTDQSTSGGANASTTTPADGAAKTNPAQGVAPAKPTPAELAAKAVAQPAAPARKAEPVAQSTTSPADADKPVTRGELDAYFASKAADAAKHSATISHNTTLAAQVEHLQAKAKDAFAALPEPIRGPMIDSLLRKYDDARLNAQYPEGHPLHGEVCGVLDEAGIAALIKDAEDTKAKIQAAILGKIGQAANNFRPSVAGNQAGQGAAAAPVNRGTLSDFVNNKVQQIMQTA